jgi:hypothetical protein
MTGILILVPPALKYNNKSNHRRFNICTSNCRSIRMVMAGYVKTLLAF